MKPTRPVPPPNVVPHQDSTEHHTRCPICGHLVDEWDLDEVMKHLEPDHKAPTKN